MIRIYICDPRAKARSTLRQAIERIASDVGITSLAIRVASTPYDALDAIAARRPGYCTLVLANAGMGLPQDIEPFSDFKAKFPDTRLVLMSGSAEAAMQAYRVHADVFIYTGNGPAEFTQVMHDQLADIAMERGETLTLKSKAGIDVLDATNILFAETSNAGPVIHLVDGRDVEMRGTLQGLYEQMGHDTRFIKAGGSFIVNLENVRSAGKSSIVFPDGSIIIVPIRARKVFQESLEAYRTGKTL